MPQFATDRGPIHFEQFGSRADAPLLLVNGFGQQLTHWPPSLIAGLVTARLRVIVFDNRDAGWSFDVAAAPANAQELFAADGDQAGADGDGVGAANETPFTPPYRLADMAADTVRVLDHLGQAGAHVVGASLGGMIAQRLAMAHPERVFSLTSMSSTAGPMPTPATPALRAALADPAPPKGETASVERAIAHAKALGGSHHDSAAVGYGRFARAAHARAHRPAGQVRQLMAAIADGDRRAGLARLRLPALVMHGDADPLLPPDEARRTATAIPGAKLAIIPTMGHDLPEPLIDAVVANIVALVHGANARR